MAPRLDIKQIVARQGQRQLRFVRQRMPVERRVDESVARRRSFVRRGAVLRRNVLDLDPAVDLATGAGQACENAQRRDLRRRPVILDRRPNRIGGQFAAPGDAARRAEPGVRIDLETVVVCLALEKAIFGQAVADDFRSALRRCNCRSGCNRRCPGRGPALWCGAGSARRHYFARCRASGRRPEIARCRRARRWRTPLGLRASAPRATATARPASPG